MKKYLFSLVFWLVFNCLFGQSVTYLSQEKTNVLSIVVQNNYFFNTKNYVPYIPADAIQYSAYATLQARYDRAHEIVSAEYWKLKNLELINKKNVDYLNEYRHFTIKWVDNNIKSADLTKQEVLNGFVKRICEIYERPEIKSEISLLKSSHTELNRIKQKDPDQYIYSKRYKSIVSVLNKLENINPSYISELSWEKEELQSANYSPPKMPNSEPTNSDINRINDLKTEIVAKFSGYKGRSNETIHLNKIEVTNSETIIYLIHTSSTEYKNGGWVNIGPEIFLKNTSNGEKYQLLKAVGIPIAPNKYEYSSSGQKLFFQLHFPIVDFRENKFDLIECESADCFNFYNIGHLEIIGEF